MRGGPGRFRAGGRRQGRRPPVPVVGEALQEPDRVGAWLRRSRAAAASRPTRPRGEASPASRSASFSRPSARTEPQGAGGLQTHRPSRLLRQHDLAQPVGCLVLSHRGQPLDGQGEVALRRRRVAEPFEPGGAGRPIVPAPGPVRRGRASPGRPPGAAEQHRGGVCASRATRPARPPGARRDAGPAGPALGERRDEHAEDPSRRVGSGWRRTPPVRRLATARPIVPRHWR